MDKKKDRFSNGIIIALTLDILKHAKRFHATVSFIADTGLKEGMELGKQYYFFFLICNCLLLMIFFSVISS